MSTLEETVKLMQELPDRLQAEVRDFAEFLATRGGETSAVRDGDWTALSLICAMRGMENEEGPTYSLSDLKETFSRCNPAR
ncbi:DUF2281 domain-containing protein [candidate division WOR-3 bacterium]|uniref:DUF2281 domain-containing protein n=1 Tax=candidate division WOR-3 bacterium TaxID=2052148 RepID=A0A937XJJ9_UNCW3|nr:DUF2281 domain-containing protein [candidate division WOR-3 bacterium]